MDTTKTYNKSFFENIKVESLRSAREIVPLVVDLIRPQSVVDVGCGTGAWIKVFQEHGVQNVLGLDGEYVDREAILFPKERFVPCDLAAPVRLDRKFDLVVSLEVAEHLPQKTSRTFVESLTNLGPVILFSSAIPFQGGVEHINEQWQDYWADLFKERNYLAIDCIRGKVWSNKKVAFWFAQNTFIYVHRDYLDSHPELQKERDKNSLPFAIVHPELFEKRAALGGLGIKQTLMALPKMILRALFRKIEGRNLNDHN